MTLAVVERFTGDSGDEPTIVITTGRGGGDCGYRFEVGRDYVVYARKTEGRALLSTDICTRTRPVGQAADDLRYGRQLGTASQFGAQVSGTLKHVERGPTGQFEVDDPMPGVPVRLTREGWYDETRTAQDGAFLFTGLDPGDYRVDAESPPGYYTRAYPSTVKITDVRGCAVIVVQGHFDGRISGRLVRPDRTPVPAVAVQARRDGWPGRSSLLEQSALTASRASGRSASGRWHSACSRPWSSVSRAPPSSRCCTERPLGRPCGRPRRRLAVFPDSAAVPLIILVTPYEPPARTGARCRQHAARRGGRRRTGRSSTGVGRPRPCGVEFVDGGTLSFTLAGTVAAHDALIVIDAAELGAASGTIQVFQDERMAAFLGGDRRQSVHEVSLLDVLAITRLEELRSSG